MGLVLVIERLGPVFQMAISLSGVAAGTVLGLFTTGMLCRKINSKVNRNQSTTYDQILYRPF